MTEQERSEETPEEGGAAGETAASKGEAKAARVIAPAGPSTAVILPRQVPGTPIVSRRRMLQIGFWASMGAAIAGAGACALDIIYPPLVTGFGGKVSVPASSVPAAGEKAQIGAGRFWLVNLTADQGGPGLLALWWRCPHLGCTVPWRPTFVWPDPTTGGPKPGWFRCPCHGSTYTDAGVRVFGPAPRSMDTMDLTVNGDGSLSVDTGKRTNGSPTNPDRAIRI